jgi:transcriptional regulator with XRE-family HTH domain
MRNIAIGRFLRIVRIRRRWRQLDVGSRASVSPSVIARHERGVIGSVAILERHAAVLDLRVDVRLVGRSGETPMLADEEHAAIVGMLAAWLRDAGFEAELEASFSEYGERGRIDILAHDQATRTLVMIEVKTLLVDHQDLLGALNVRRRLAPTLARRRGWQVSRTVTMLAVARTPLNRRAVASHPSLFDSFSVRRLGRAAIASTDALLVWIGPQRAARDAWIAGRQRVRPRRGRS